MTRRPRLTNACYPFSLRFVPGSCGRGSSIAAKAAGINFAAALSRASQKGCSLVVRRLVAPGSIIRHAADRMREHVDGINDGTRDMPPGHDLIGADQHQIALVEIVRFLVVDTDYLEVQPCCDRRRQKCVGLTLIVAEAKQGPFETEAIEQRAAIPEPDMRRASAGFAGRHIGGR